MSKTQWLGRILIVVIALGILIAAGYAIYRVGYTRGAVNARAGEGFEARFPDRFRAPQDKLDESPFWPRGGPGLPQNAFDPRVGVSSRLFGARPFFSPVLLILKVAFVGVVLWLLYKVVTLIFRGNGWQLTFRSLAADTDTADINSPGENEG
jgi:hypothetical protein